MTAGRDLEKGLEIARSILNGSNENEHQDVLLLLHVYILPVIRLHASDRKHVSTALDSQIQVLSDLDSAIDKMTSERHDIKKTMKDWRHDICNQLKDEKAIASCNVQFLQMLHQHLQNDLRNAYVELDGCQERVEQCKGSLTKRRGSQYITDLVEARKSRDRVAEYINKALFVMEEVNLILSVTTLPERNELTDQHRAYIEIQEECKRHSKELHDLQRKKLLATSVREALVSTESELKQGRETTGIDISSDGLKRSTDVLGQNSLPDAWQTLPSKVSEALEKNKTLNELHHDFSLRIVNHCRDEIQGQPSIRRLRPKIVVSSSWKKLQAAKRSSSNASNNGSNRHSGEGERVRRNTRHTLKEKKPSAHFQAVTQTLKSEITQHFIEVTKLLASHLNIPYAYSRSDLWSCYERAFYPGKVSELLKLYVYAYEGETGQLQKILPRSTLQDMQLDDEWMLNILGLYAPSFTLQDDVEIAVEVTAPDLTEIRPMIDKVPRDLIEGHNLGLPGEKSSLGLKDVLKEKLSVDDNARGRLESGVEIDLPQDRIRQRVSPQHSTEARNSWRNTQIIDFRWVSVPIDIADANAVFSEPSKRSASSLLGKDEIAARHTSCPEMKVATDNEQCDQYLEQQSTSLTKKTERFNPFLKKDMLEDQIGDDSGVFNEQHEEVRHNPRGDLNSNVLRHQQKATEPSISGNSNDTGKEKIDSGDRVSRISEAGSSISKISLASDVEKMSIASSQDNMAEADVTIMIQGEDGEVKLDRELSRRCRERPAIAEFLKRFSQAYHYFRVVLEESVPTSKLQWLLRCLKEVNAVAEKEAALISCGKQRKLSGDDLLTALILFLTHGDPGEVTAFFPQLRFLEDYLPDFLDKGEIGFCVIQFETAYSYILRIERGLGLNS